MRNTPSDVRSPVGEYRRACRLPDRSWRTEPLVLVRFGEPIAPASADVSVPFPCPSQRQAVVAAGHAGARAEEVLSGYIIGTAAVSFVGAASQFVIMVVLGLPLAVPIAILSFIACFIPYVGGFVTTGLAFLVALAFGSPTQIAIMFVYTIVFNIV